MLESYEIFDTARKCSDDGVIKAPIGLSGHVNKEKSLKLVQQELFADELEDVEDRVMRADGALHRHSLQDRQNLLFLLVVEPQLERRGRYKRNLVCGLALHR